MVAANGVKAAWSWIMRVDKLCRGAGSDVQGRGRGRKGRDEVGASSTAEQCVCGRVWICVFERVCVCVLPEVACSCCSIKNHCVGEYTGR